MKLLNNIKSKVLKSLGAKETEPGVKLDFLTLFGRLLYEVAAVSSGASDEELEVIKDIMRQDMNISENEWEYTLRIIRELADQDINLRKITSEFNSLASYKMRQDLIEDLLKVASADRIIEKVEFNKIKWIAKYLWITPKDFNSMKEKYQSRIEF